MPKQVRTAASLVCLVAVAASISGYRTLLTVWPWIRSLPIPTSGRTSMWVIVPTLLFVTLDTETGVRIRHYQKTAEFVIMRVVTTRALHLARVIEANLLGQRRRHSQFSTSSRQIGVKHEGNRVMVPQIRPGSSPTRRHPVCSFCHRDGRSTIEYFTQSDGTVVTTEAQ